MYFEIYKGGKLVKRGNEILNNISWNIELMEVPEMDLTLPIEYLDYLSGREEIKVYANDKIFWGIVIDIEVDKAEETIDVDLRHIVFEWTYRQVSINNAIKDEKVNVVFKGSETKTAGGVTVTANPFNLLLKEVGTISNSQIISRAGASAWRSNGDKATVSVNTSKIEKKEGDYDVTFSSGGASVTVKATVKKKNDEEKSESSSSTDPSVVDNLSDIYADTNFAYPGWQINFQGNAGDREIDYVYSKQNKLEALTQTCELTEDLFWRVDFSGEKVIDVGVFGEKKPYIISEKPQGAYNIQLIEEPTIDYEFENVINLATVYSPKSDGGMSSLTLREVYEKPELQTKGFPVLILRANVNNEKNYRAYSTQFPKLAPNNWLEYAVLDEESVALEGGNIIEECYDFNDIGAFNIDSDKIRDEDREKCAITVYNATKRKLKQARRSHKLNITTTELPLDIKVGDRVRFLYDNSIYKLEACSNYMKKILTMDDWFYITDITIDIAEGEYETAELTLEKYIKVDRETKNT